MRWGSILPRLGSVRSTRAHGLTCDVIPEIPFMLLCDPGRDQTANIASASVDHNEHLAQHFPDRLKAFLAIRSRVFALKHVTGEDATDVGKIEATVFKDLVALSRIILDDREGAVAQAERT